MLYTLFIHTFILAGPVLTTLHYIYCVDLMLFHPLIVSQFLLILVVVMRSLRLFLQGYGIRYTVISEKFMSR